jgi:hypothetical protein
MIPTISSFTLLQRIPNAELIICPDLGHGSQFLFRAMTERYALEFNSDDTAGYFSDRWAPFLRPLPSNVITFSVLANLKTRFSENERAKLC